MMDTQRPPSPNEAIKANSRFLRGTIADGLTRVETGSLSDDDQQLTKFHGIYVQDDRDLRAERGRKKMEKAFIFMARLRVPGGVLTPRQWLAAERIARERGNGTLRLTTRQTIQFHGIIKSNLRHAIQRPERRDARHHRRLRRREPQRDRARQSVAEPRARRSGGAGAGDRGASAAEEPRLARDLDRRRTARRRRGRRRTDLRPHLHAAEVQDRRRIAAAQRRRRVRARPGLHRDRGGRPHRRLQRGGRRRHGHDAWRARHLPAHRRRDRLLHARSGGGRRGEGRDGAARLRRPLRSQARAAEIHHRAHGSRRIPRRTRAPAGSRAAARARLRLHRQRRPARLGGRRRRHVALHAVRREWPRARSRAAARDRRTRHRPVHHHAEPEPGAGRHPVRPEGRGRDTAARASASMLPSAGCDAMRWRASRCRPAASRWPRASATCRT